MPGANSDDLGELWRLIRPGRQNPCRWPASGNKIPPREDLGWVRPTHGTFQLRVAPPFAPLIWRASSPRSSTTGGRVIPCCLAMRKAITALIGLTVLACRPRPAGPVTEGPVILISIDTLRADHLPVYGYRSGATPVLDALSRDGVVLEEAYSHCPLTLPAHASLFTGLLPPHHGVRDNLGFTLNGAQRTLAARFKGAGWRTGGAVSAFVLRASTGIAQGFDFYDDAVEIEGAPDSISSMRRDGAAAVEALGRWVDLQPDRRFFAFLHLYEPHAPYAPPERYRLLGQPYDGAIAYADELLGRFLDRLKRRNLFDGALVAVVSDHGEGLWDHGEAEHGILLYREALHVPFVLRLPHGGGKGRRVGATVALVDVPATLLDLAGLPAGGMDGSTLRTVLGGEPGASRRVYTSDGATCTR
jgi:hypothetical protein